MLPLRRRVEAVPAFTISMSSNLQEYGTCLCPEHEIHPRLHKPLQDVTGVEDDVALATVPGSGMR